MQLNYGVIIDGTARRSKAVPLSFFAVGGGKGGWPAAGGTHWAGRRDGDCYCMPVSFGRNLIRHGVLRPRFGVVCCR